MIAAVSPKLQPYTAGFPGKYTFENPGGKTHPTAEAFAPFKDRLGLSWSEDYFYIESNGIPDHQMMVGITAWQQQVPLPHGYVKDNAWRLPLKPVPSADPAMIKGRFLRGAIAIGVNGIPIFNPQNNRGEISQEIGELDQWGGHCGRGDDYHYHIAPLHLEKVVGKGNPVAYALDGYPVLGLSEADGTIPGDLDKCSGHDHDGLGYHYHATESYPYVIGGFHGEVVEAEGQVDPQPRAEGVRPAERPLRGAEITGFSGTIDQGYTLEYQVDGKKASIQYQVTKTGADFTYHDSDGSIRKQSYQHSPGGKGKGRPKEDKGKGDRRRPEQ
ncbi:MAG: YHYH protein [Verrucomicrobiales bacterium]|nr:YHYH protein [Verrucomicrobiales bacterium]